MVDAVPNWQVLLLEVKQTQIVKKQMIDVAKVAKFEHFASTEALRFISGDISGNNVVLLFNVMSNLEERFLYQVNYA